MSPQSESQEYIKFECRMCKKKTNQIERIVTDMLPPNVKTLQCCTCGAMSMCLMDTANNANV